MVFSGHDFLTMHLDFFKKREHLRANMNLKFKFNGCLKNFKNRLSTVCVMCTCVYACHQCVLYAPVLLLTFFFFTKSHGLTRCCAL